LTNPSNLTPVDYADAKIIAPQTLFATMKALHAFQKEKGALPGVWAAADADDVVARAKALQVQGCFNESMSKDVALTARGALAPLTGFLGGLVAQEAIKGVSNKFMPLSQWVRCSPSLPPLFSLTGRLTYTRSSSSRPPR